MTKHIPFQKLLLTCCYCLLFVGGFAQDTTAVLSKAPIQAATEENIAKDKSLLQAVFTGQTPAKTLFGTLVLIGPRLWSKMKDLPQFRDIKRGNITYKVPVFREDGGWSKTTGLEGKALQTSEDFDNFWQYLNTTFHIAEAQLATRNNRDNFLYWTYFAKIEEPLLVYTTSNARLMFNVLDSKHLFFVELNSD